MIEGDHGRRWAMKDDLEAIFSFPISRQSAGLTGVRGFDPIQMFVTNAPDATRNC
jgi:hypothetical protein